MKSSKKSLGKVHLYQKIADLINSSMKTQGGVDVAQVMKVAIGHEKCLSHPVISRIRSELRDHGLLLEEV